jgi:hypothetical protein
MWTSSLTIWRPFWPPCAPPRKSFDKSLTAPRNLSKATKFRLSLLH